MKRFNHQNVILFLLVLLAGPVKGQQTLPYKTMSLQDVMKAYNEQQDYVFLDVRTPGEYNDTSRWASANIGHIKNAINIPVQELDKRINELRQYQDRKILVYCSHSYRSRRASEMLIDSGFKHVYNMNSGLSGFYNLDHNPEADAPGMIVSGTNYRQISAGVLYDLLKVDKNVQLIEIVPESYEKWDSASIPLYQLLGSFKPAAKYTYRDVKANDGKLAAMKGKTIVVYSTLSMQSSKAAEWLAGNGFKSVYCLANGILSWYYFVSMKDAAEVKEDIKPYVFADNNSFRIISVKKACILAGDPKTVILDIRSAKAFNDTTEGQVYNYTHLGRSVNLPAADIEHQGASLKQYQNREVLVIDEDGTAVDIAAIKYLAAQGLKVSYIPSGLMHWEWYNNNDATFNCGNMLNLLNK